MGQERQHFPTQVIAPDIGPSMSPGGKTETPKLETSVKEEFLGVPEPAKSPSILERALIKTETETGQQQQQANDLSGDGNTWNNHEGQAADCMTDCQQADHAASSARSFEAGRDGRNGETAAAAAAAAADPNPNNSDSNRPINFIQPFESHLNNPQPQGFVTQESANMTGWMR